MDSGRINQQQLHDGKDLTCKLFNLVTCTLGKRICVPSWWPLGKKSTTPRHTGLQQIRKCVGFRTVYWSSWGSDCQIWYLDLLRLITGQGDVDSAREQLVGVLPDL